jgi:prepilin-type N-terminal cleavage/methylation domain-containing protein
MPIAENHREQRMDRRTKTARSTSGFSLVEVLVAVAAAVILAAVLTPMAFTYLDESRIARAHADAATVSAAMMRFFQDTKKWPGQVEILDSPAIRFLTVGDATPTSLPTLAGTIGIGAATCADGLSGVQAGVTSFAAASPTTVNTLNVTDLLQIPPPVADYPNWKGPYLTSTLEGDPWESVYIINIIPLFCGEPVTTEAPGGALGFAWILSGGPNRTLQTPFTSVRVTVDSDDAGVPLSKRIVQGS